MNNLIERNINRVISFTRNIYNNANKVIDRLTNAQKVKPVFWLVTILLCFSILLLLNILTPMIADDFCYLFIYGGDYQTKVTSFYDIFISQKNHYYLWGGRSVVHFIAQALLLLPPIVIDLLNSLVYLVYVGLIYLLIRGQKAKNSIVLFVLINLAVWFLQPAFGDTILWITGSANYLWGTVFVLLFLLPFRFYKAENNKSKYILIKSFLFFLFGIVAGWTNENTAIGMIVISILYLLYYRYNHWKIPVWGILGILGAIIGYLIMVSAPGNYSRGGEAIKFDLLVFAYRLFHHTQNFIENCGLLNLLGIILIILLYYFSKVNKVKIMGPSLLFFIGVLVSVYVMIFSPSFPPRAWLGIITYNIIAVGILLNNLNFSYKFIRQIYHSIFLVGIIAFPFSLYIAYKDVYSLYALTEHRKELVEEAKRKGQKHCVFERYNAKTKFVHSEDPKAYEFMYGYYDIDIRFKD